MRKIRANNNINDYYLLVLIVQLYNIDVLLHARKLRKGSLGRSPMLPPLL